MFLNTSLGVLRTAAGRVANPTVAGKLGADAFNRVEGEHKLIKPRVLPIVNSKLTKMTTSLEERSAPTADCSRRVELRYLD